MVGGGVSSFFLNPVGLVFLAFMIPLILLYLIKPKPLKRSIPSLMFILSDSGRNKVNKMFRNFLADFLLLLQFLILLFLLLSIAQPFINVPQSFLVQDTVMIIDVSASMTVGERWDDIKTAALDNLAERNTIILAQGFPEMIAEEATAARAKKLIRELEPKGTTTNLADALKLATEFAGPGTNVIVLSDFLPSEGPLDIETQLESLNSKGALITTIIVGEPTSNVGIIDLAVRDDISKVWIKNHAEEPNEVTLAIGENEQKILLARRETKEISFNTPEGVTELVIKEDDDFMLDNTAWVSTPTDNIIDMLVFTNNQEGFENSNLRLALDLIQQNFPVQFNIEYAIPPKVPDLEHEVYLFHEVNPKFLLPGNVKDLKERIEDGAALILLAQSNLFAIDYRGMLPVDFVEEASVGEVRAVTENLLTKDINFAQVSSHFKTTASEGVTVLATVDDSPIVTISKLSEGTIVYFGYLEGKESFSNDNSYPIFWRRLIDLVTNRPSLQNLNVRTGTVITFPTEIKIKTPTEKITTRMLRTEKSGLYALPDRTIAANLRSDLESNINRAAVIGEETIGDGEEEEKRVPKDLSQIFILTGIFFLFFELFYVKHRGDF